MKTRLASIIGGLALASFACRHLVGSEAPAGDTAIAETSSSGMPPEFPLLDGAADVDNASDADASADTVVVPTGCDCADVEVLPGPIVPCQPHTAPIDPARCAFDASDGASESEEEDDFCYRTFGGAFMAFRNPDGTFACAFCQ